MGPYVACFSCGPICFFCIDAATPEIYTYSHTLSLHDALPMFGHHGRIVRADRERGQQGAHAVESGELPHRHAGALRLEFPQRAVERVARAPSGQQGAQRFAVDTRLDAWAQRLERRSEEHTSELQSLMRISYAVFCLKKK